ncbi:MAG: hypothetical protein IK016_02185 [Lachnospiraceae bacterium]|nr:hypothetical protein [Lachnospiraceae bacterium]
MIKNKTPEEYLALLEVLERTAPRDRAFHQDVRSRADAALAAGDAFAFVQLREIFETPEHRQILSRSSELMKFRYIIGAVRHEMELRLPLFTRSISSYDELMERYEHTTLYLRRLEFDLEEPFATEALQFLREESISSFAVSAIIYNIVSHLGHREKVLLKLAEDALNRGRSMDAYSFLNVIESPSESTALLKEEIAEGLKGGLL